MLEDYLKLFKKIYRITEVNFKKKGGKSTAKEFEKRREGMNRAFRVIQSALNRIKKLPMDRQGEAMTELWNNWVKHEGGSTGKWMEHC